jgi:tungstate transport system substrate-binding protein
MTIKIIIFLIIQLRKYLIEMILITPGNSAGFPAIFKIQKKDKTMKHTSRYLLLTLLLVFSLALGACAPAATAVLAEPPASTEAPAPAPTEPPAPTEAPAPANPTLILATTTSLQDSGLLDALIPLFQEQTGYTVQTVAVGSGAAIQMGREGNADVLFVHSPADEKTLMSDGFGKERVLIAHNDFIIVGPEADPAAIKGLSPVDAFKAIYAAGSPFVARADKSGTSTKELGFWKKAELDPATEKPTWYIETGQGMGASLTIASEKGAYILTDRGTFLANKDTLQLTLLVEGDPSLLNVYHVITVNPEKWPKVNYDGAVAFLNFMLSPTAQDFMATFGVDKFGIPLFSPDGGKTDADLGL